MVGLFGSAGASAAGSANVVKHVQENEDSDTEFTLEDEREVFERRKKVIESSWRAVRFGLDVKASKLFYDKLFEEHPCTRELFQDDMTAQYNMLFGAVTRAVRFLDSPDDLIPVLKDLGMRHARYGVVAAHYEAFTECFLWTLNSYIFSNMPNQIAIEWALDVADSWEWALTYIGNIMGEAGEEEIERQRAAKRTQMATRTCTSNSDKS